MSLPLASPAHAESAAAKARPSPIETSRRAVILTYAVLVVVATLLFLLMKDRLLIGDEPAHGEQVQAVLRWLAEGEPFVPVHPTLPGHHLLLAAFAFVTGESGVPYLRGFSLVLNLVGLVAVYRLAFALSGERWLSAIRLAQAFCFAVAFPFFFLIYTDVFSALVVLLVFALLLGGHAVLAGLIGALSIGIRQINVLWLSLAFLLVCAGACRAVRPRSVRNLLSAALRNVGLWKQTAPFLLGFVLFGVFVVWNDGAIALADHAAHPAFSFHAGNVWGFLFTAFIVFLPHNLARTPAIARLWRRHRPGILLFGGLLFVVYMVTYVNTHFYNFNPWWLRNKVVLLSTSTAYWKALFFLPILYQTLVFAVTPLWRRSLYLLYPVTLVCLASSWMIEPRYYITPLLLFLLFRKPETRQTEIDLLTWNASLAVVLFYGAWQRLYLP